MIDEATVRFLEGGCALIVGGVGPDGAPHATRGWGLDVLPGLPGPNAEPGPGLTVRLLLAADDPLVAPDADIGALAITAADVTDFRSLQFKGRARGVEPADDADRARAARYCAAFFADIAEADDTPMSVVSRLAPGGYVTCTVDIDRVFDQTPGPGAGAAVGPPGAEGSAGG
jgi:hypothetical protein